MSPVWRATISKVGEEFVATYASDEQTVEHAAPDLFSALRFLQQYIIPS